MASQTHRVAPPTAANRAVLPLELRLQHATLASTNRLLLCRAMPTGEDCANVIFVMQQAPTHRSFDLDLAPEDADMLRAMKHAERLKRMRIESQHLHENGPRRDGRLVEMRPLLHTSARQLKQHVKI